MKVRAGGGIYIYNIVCYIATDGTRMEVTITATAPEAVIDVRMRLLGEEAAAGGAQKSLCVYLRHSDSRSMITSRSVNQPGAIMDESHWCAGAVSSFRSTSTWEPSGGVGVQRGEEACEDCDDGGEYWEGALFSESRKVGMGKGGC